MFISALAVCVKALASRHGLASKVQALAFKRVDALALTIHQWPFQRGPPLLYLGNDTRYGHSYYRMRIGNRIQSFECYLFNDLEVLLIQISRLRHYLTLNL